MSVVEQTARIRDYVASLQHQENMRKQFGLPYDPHLTDPFFQVEDLVASDLSIFTDLMTEKLTDEKFHYAKENLNPNETSRLLWFAFIANKLTIVSLRRQLTRRGYHGTA